MYVHSILESCCADVFPRVLFLLDGNVTHTPCCLIVLVIQAAQYWRDSTVLLPKPLNA